MSPSPQEAFVDTQSPTGKLRLFLVGENLSRVQLQPSSANNAGAKAGKSPPHIQSFLSAYFQGQAVSAEHAWLLPARPSFAQKIYRALMDVPFGQLITYGSLAEKAGYTSQHARAVGQAMNNNPWPLFVPCHRVVASGNRLGGFGGGLALKSKLLRHEGIAFPAQSSANMNFNSPLQQVSHDF